MQQQSKTTKKIKRVDTVEEDQVISFILGVDAGMKDPDFLKHIVKRLVIIMGLTAAQAEMFEFVDGLEDLI